MLINISSVNPLRATTHGYTVICQTVCLYISTLLLPVHTQYHRCHVYSYGDVTAKQFKEQLFSVLMMLIGMTVVMGFILGGWSSLLTNYYTHKSAFVHRVETINACLVSSPPYYSLPILFMASG